MVVFPDTTTTPFTPMSTVVVPPPLPRAYRPHWVIATMRASSRKRMGCCSWSGAVMPLVVEVTTTLLSAAGRCPLLQDAPINSILTLLLQVLLLPQLTTTSGVETEVVPAVALPHHPPPKKSRFVVYPKGFPQKNPLINVEDA